MKRRLARVVLVSMVVAVLIGAQPASAQLTITDLGMLPGGGDFEFSFSRANDINNRGQIVGSSMTASTNTHAFLWEKGKMTDLGTLPGGGEFGFSVASGINNRGQVVGFSTTAFRENHAFLWEKGKITDLGTLPGS